MGKEKINDGGQAYPSNREVSYEQTWDHTEGMSLRDYFAGQVIGSFLPDLKMSDDILSEQAYEVADAMIKARGE